MNTLVRLLLLAALIIYIPFDMGCCPCNAIVTAPTLEVPTIPPPIVKSKVVLITLDGVRWQEVFNGVDHSFLNSGESVSARELLPNIYHYFVDNGMVVGRDSKFIATGPMHISLPGYLEIMRGHPSTDCQTNNCENVVLDDNMTFLFKESAVIASWDTIRKTVPSTVVINSGRSFRSEAWKKLGLDDNQAFQEYWEPEYRPDFLTKDAALDYFQYNNPDFFWISLGDTDEWAHAGNYEQYLESLKSADEFIGQVIKMVEHSYDKADYTFIITADHGRSLFWNSHGEDAASARNWLMMTGRGVPSRGFVSYKEVKSLSNILPTVKFLVTGLSNKDSLL